VSLDGLDGGLRAGVVRVEGDGDVGTQLAEEDGRLAADASRGASDERDLSLEFKVHLRS
jgi:hypothetical protein